MESEAELRQQIQDLQAQLDICAWATLVLVAHAEATLAMLTSETSEGARNQTAQILRTRLREVKTRVKVKPIKPPETET